MGCLQKIRVQYSKMQAQPLAAKLDPPYLPRALIWTKINPKIPVTAICLGGSL